MDNIEDVERDIEHLKDNYEYYKNRAKKINPEILARKETQLKMMVGIKEVLYESLIKKRNDIIDRITDETNKLK